MSLFTMMTLVLVAVFVLTATTGAASRGFDAEPTARTLGDVDHWNVDHWNVDRFTCPADIDQDREVGISDLREVLTNWGHCACRGDVAGHDGMIDFDDLLEVLRGWGTCPGA